MRRSLAPADRPCPIRRRPGCTWTSACVGIRHAEQRIARRDHLAQTLADDQQHVGIAHARRELRVRCRCRRRPRSVAWRLSMRSWLRNAQATGRSLRCDEAREIGAGALRSSRCRRRAPAAAARRASRARSAAIASRRRMQRPSPRRARRRRRRRWRRACPPAAPARPGPGGPTCATRNACATYSGMRSARSICATHLAMLPYMRR